MIHLIMTLICCLFVVPGFSHEEEAKQKIFLSTPEQIATLSSEPRFLVGDIVSPLSGSPSLRQTDLIVKGAQELILSRTYIPPHIPVQLGSEKQCQKEWEKYHLYHHVARCYKGWQFYPHLKLQYTPSEKRILVTQPSDGTLSFVFTDSGNAEFEGEIVGIVLEILLAVQMTLEIPDSDAMIVGSESQFTQQMVEPTFTADRKSDQVRIIPTTNKSK